MDGEKCSLAVFTIITVSGMLLNNGLFEIEMHRLVIFQVWYYGSLLYLVGRHRIKKCNSLAVPHYKFK